MAFTSEEGSKVDIRTYIGMLVFRWHIIVICFLYCLLAGVLYLVFAPRVYQTDCKVMIHKDRNLDISKDRGRNASPWSSFGVHTYLLQSQNLRERVAKDLLTEWGERMGGLRKMVLPVAAGRERRVASTLNISVKSGDGEYGLAFLTKLMEEHQKEWTSIQRSGQASAAKLLDEELQRLEEKIRFAEDDLIEYRRLNDIARVERRAAMEEGYLEALMLRRNQLTTELMLLESQYPMLKNANAAVISGIGAITHGTSTVEPIDPDKDGRDGDNAEGGRKGSPDSLKLPDVFAGGQGGRSDIGSGDGRGFLDLRVQLYQLQQKEKELLKTLTPEHQKVKAVRQDIERINNNLELAAKIAMGKIRDRHDILLIQLKAVEEAEYKWKAKNLLASQRQAELKRKSGVVTRYEENYNTLYSRLHTMKVAEELDAERFRIVEAVETIADAVWPDPMKVLLMAVGLGLGMGFGISVLAQVLDNRVQSISDVEGELGVTFLGGVPFWVHSGLEKTIRPIVTEEHSTGAVEAYRSLRTSIIGALSKVDRKVMLVTSADSREGKTLTALNLSIMISQMKKKVLLIDMDIRRGRLHRSLGVDRDPGLTNVLSGDMELKDVVHDTKIENVKLITSGKTISNSAELLQSTDMKELIDGIKDDYDYVIIDTSPVLRVTDTVIVAEQDVGVVLYIARANKTPKPMIQYSLEILRDAQIIGLVINSIEMHKISSLYYTYQYPTYAYYSNAYAYGQDYYYDGTGKGEGKKSRRARYSVGEGKGVDKIWRDTKRWLRRTFLPMD